MFLDEREMQVLRTLAEKYAEIAALPEQETRRAMWRRHNACIPEKPMVLLDQLPWNELDVDGSLICEVSDPYWRRVEAELRRTLYRWEHMPVDMVVNPYVTLPRPIRNAGWGIQAKVTRLYTDATSDVQSQHMECQINDFEDLERIIMPEITLDRDREREIEYLAEHVFYGIR